MNMEADSTQVIAEIRILNGLHMAPAIALVTHANRYDIANRISIGTSKKMADAKSIMQVSMLAAGYQTKLFVSTTGPDHLSLALEFKDYIEKELFFIECANTLARMINDSGLKDIKLLAGRLCDWHSHDLREWKDTITSDNSDILIVNRFCDFLITLNPGPNGEYIGNEEVVEAFEVFASGITIPESKIELFGETLINELRFIQHE